MIDAGNGNWISQGGNHRIAAAIANGDTSIPATADGVVSHDALASHVQDQLDASAAKAPAPEAAPSTTDTPLLAPKSEAKIEPAANTINVSKGRPDLSPEDVAQRFDQIRAAEAAARASGGPDPLRELAARLATPPTKFATAVASSLPDSVNHVLAHFADIADQRHIHDAWRKVEQVMETAQNIARTSPAMKEGVAAAELLLSKDVGRPAASRIIGEELRARLSGSAMVAEYAQSHAGEVADATFTKTAYAAARGKDVGLTDAMLQKLPEADRAALQAHLDSAVDGFRTLNKQTLQTLVATRYGARGLESAVLGDRSATMNPEQVRMYHQAMTDYKYSQKLALRTNERVALERNVAKQEVLGEKAYGVINTLRNKLGVTEQIVRQLFQPIPKGLANDGAKTIDAVMNEIAAHPDSPGATIDVGTGEAVHPTTGITISMADQRTLTDAEWHSAQLPEILNSVLVNPKAPDGSIYTPDQLWGGVDARLGVWQDPATGNWSIDISASTNNGKPLEPWQAKILGEGFQQKTGFDNATGNVIPFSQDSHVQDLNAHFIDQALRPNSAVSMYAAQLTKDGATAEQVSAAIQIRLAADQSFGERLPLHTAYGAHDPLSAQYTPVRGDVNVKQARWETDTAFAERARQYGEARDSVNGVQQQIRQAEQRASLVNKHTLTMQGLLLEPTRQELTSAMLQGRAEDTLAKLSQQLDQADANIPQAWKPMMAAWTALADEAKNDTSGSMLQALGEIPQTFSAVLHYAAQNGFEPTHVPDLTWQMANKYLTQHINLGPDVVEAGTRKASTGALDKAGLAIRSLEALGSAQVMAMKENLQNQLAGFIESTYAHDLAPGTAIPAGWHSWDAARSSILLGRNVEGDVVSTNAGKIIPDAVYKALQGVTKPVPDMPFRTLFKGGPTAVWKNLLLTWSPSWYIKHFVGAVSLATLEGVGFHDWLTAWKQFKSGTLPDVVNGRSIYQVLDEQVGKAGTVIPRNGVKDIPDLVRSEGYKQAGMEINAKLKNVVKTTDGLARAAVYERTLRVGGSVDKAASRAYEAIGDFGRLTPLERGIVTNIMPFYAFQKSMLRILMKLPIDHPLAAALFLQTGTMHQAYMKQQLGGSLPDNYNSSDFINGKLMREDKLNPLTDSYKLVTPQGIAASLHPFLSVLAQDALNSPSFGAKASMGTYGELESTPNILQTLQNAYMSAPSVGAAGDIASGDTPGLSSLMPASALSDVQYQKLLKRILATQTAQQTVAGGGYLVTSAFKPKAPVATPFG